MGAAAVMTVISITAFEILIALAVLAMLALRRPWRVPPIWLPLALFMGGTVISLLASGHARDGLPQIRKMYVYLMLFLVASTFRNVRQIARVCLLWALAGVICALRATEQCVEKYRLARDAHQDFYLFYVDHRATGFLDHWMTLGGAMMMLLLVIGAMLWFASSRRPAILIPAAILLAAGLAESWTRSMWGGAICGFIYLVWFWRKWALLLLPLAAAVALLILPSVFLERAESSFSPHGSVDSNLHRVELREIGWQMIKAHPWLGVGPEQVARQVPRYLPPGVPMRPNEYYGHLENDYLQYAAERGIPTMLVLLWMIAWAAFDFARALRRLPPRAGERWILHAAIAVILAMLLSGFYSWNLNNSHLLAMFLTVLGFGYCTVNSTGAELAIPNCITKG